MRVLENEGIMKWKYYDCLTSLRHSVPHNSGTTFELFHNCKWLANKCIVFWNGFHKYVLFQTMCFRWRVSNQGYFRQMHMPNGFSCGVVLLFLLISWHTALASLDPITFPRYHWVGRPVLQPNVNRISKTSQGDDQALFVLQRAKEPAPQPDPVMMTTSRDRRHEDDSKQVCCLVFLLTEPRSNYFRTSVGPKIRSELAGVENTVTHHTFH